MLGSHNTWKSGQLELRKSMATWEIRQKTQLEMETSHAARRATWALGCLTVWSSQLENSSLWHSGGFPVSYRHQQFCLLVLDLTAEKTCQSPHSVLTLHDPWDFAELAQEYHCTHGSKPNHSHRKRSGLYLQQNVQSHSCPEVRRACSEVSGLPITWNVQGWDGHPCMW